MSKIEKLEAAGQLRLFSLEAFVVAKKIATVTKTVVSEVKQGWKQLELDLTISELVGQVKATAKSVIVKIGAALLTISNEFFSVSDAENEIRGLSESDAIDALLGAGFQLRGCN